jgi:hypothetical protein
MKYRVLLVASCETNPTKIYGQLYEYLALLRLKKSPHLVRKKIPANVFTGSRLESLELDEDDHDCLISETERLKIRRRAQRLAELRLARSGVGHLKKEEITRLQPLIGDVPMICIASEHKADEIAATLHEKAPWMAAATEYVWHALRLSARRGEAVRIPPVILNGPPGIGKSYWCRELASALRMPFADLDASKGGAGMSIVGLERGWGSAQPGRPVEVMIASQSGNPMMIVDEICKAKNVSAQQGTGYSFADSLLSVLEPATSAAWECPYYRVRFNMSYVSWIMTANDARRVPETILSRCQVIELRDLQPDELHEFLDRQGQRMQLSQIAIDVAHDVLDASAELLSRRMTLRDIGRILMRAGDLEERQLLH